MTPERWQQVKDLFDQAMATEPVRRDAFLREACAGDEELHEELVSLIRYGTAGNLGNFLEEPVVQGQPAGDPMIDRVFGAYRVVRQIGRGGMGWVYLATRDDDQFRRRVALKLIRPELADRHTLLRFQNERQALAVLDHPNIIKLLDGGQAEDGSPYLVMDYVEGLPLDEYCDSHKLDIRERLELFRTVCAAVHYAHQSLVVHRDLKPGNILVTPQGVPKLLDFGIAKLLRPEYSAQAIGITRTRMQPMTPKYASPEQVLGQPITTASDIYALGVLLYELLTGQHPFEREASTELELENAIAGLDPEKPSVAASREPGEATAKHFRAAPPNQLSRLLSGDLDAIVLKAMRKEPQRRYASAEHLAEDLRRRLDGLPVLARKGTARYRLTKFIRRHKLGVSAGLLVAGSLISSTYVAERARQNAERRFQDMRDLNHFMVNDLDDLLRSGQGATKARQALLAKAVRSSDRLAQAAKDDPGLQRDLVDAYIKMGDVQGNLWVANLGEKKAAEESYRKALTLAQSMENAYPSDTNSLTLAAAYGKLADNLTCRKDAPGQYLQALKIYRALPVVNRDAQNGMMRSLDKIGSTQEQLGDWEGALQTYRDLLDRARKLKSKSASALFGERVAYFAALNGATEGAEEMVTNSLDFYRHAEPGTRSANPRNTAIGKRTLAEVQKRKGKIDAALASVRESLEITNELLAKDPHDEEKLIDQEQGDVLLIDLLSTSGRQDLQRQETARVLSRVKPLLDRPETHDYQLSDFASLLATTPFPELQDRAAAIEYAKKAVAMTCQEDPVELDVLARAYDRNGDLKQAVQTETSALGLLRPLAPGARPSELRTMLQTNLQDFQRRLASKN